ncbi:MAG: anti-sigma regulatory factor [Bacillota bacterium]
MRLLTGANNVIDNYHGNIVITDESDIILARKTIREISGRLGFSLTDVTRIVTATSELARNICLYAGSGVMSWRYLERGNEVGIEMTFEDHGPGIADPELAMQEGYSTGSGLGLGLPGSRRLMDELEIRSRVGEGTTVIVKKWRRY